jgi:hypothetical protein
VLGGVYAQDCSGGLACYDFGAPVCVPEGLARLGEPCQEPYDCAKALDCSFGSSQWLCAPYCDPMDGDSALACDTLCPGGFAEVVDTVIDDNGEFSFPTIGGVCHGGTGTGACNPLNQEECDEGYGCFGREATTCQPEGDLLLGETCFPLGVVCEAGTTCVAIFRRNAARALRRLRRRPSQRARQQLARTATIESQDPDRMRDAAISEPSSQRRNRSP